MSLFCLVWPSPEIFSPSCVCIVDLQDRFVEVVVVALFSELIESLKLFNVDIFNSCNVGFFCIAIFWSSLAYESDEQKPKHCLT